MLVHLGRFRIRYHRSVTAAACRVSEVDGVAGEMLALPILLLALLRR